MPTGTVRTLSQAQIAMLQKIPHIGTFQPKTIYSWDNYNNARTWHSLRKMGIVYENPVYGNWSVRWDLLSEHLYKQIFPGSLSRTYRRELQRLNDMALDFSKGSNAKFMQQIRIVKDLREMLIKAEK